MKFSPPSSIQTAVKEVKESGFCCTPNQEPPRVSFPGESKVSKAPPRSENPMGMMGWWSATVLYGFANKKIAWLNNEIQRKSHVPSLEWWD